MIRELEPGYFTVDNVGEIMSVYENRFNEKGIHTLYKVRNWREKYHPEFLTKGEIYFSMPSELNDPFDIHRPIKFDTSIINSPEFLEKLTSTAPLFLGSLPGRDSEAAAENYLENVIKKNPEVYFMKNYVGMINDPNYNSRLGVFSLTHDISNDQLWGYYGGGLKGFAVGFDSLKLIECLFCQGEFVRYTDEIKISGIINQSLKSMADDWFAKNPKWGFESEFRFVKVIEDNEQRKYFYNPEIVREIILGPRINPKDEKEILECCENKYPHAAILKMTCNYAKGILECINYF